MTPCTSDRLDKIEVDTDVLWALAKKRNRRILRYFEEMDRKQATVDELADYLVAQRTGRYRNDPRGAAICLHHDALPELGDLGIIEYDADSRTVRNPGERAIPADLKEDVLALSDDD